jgi:hypothetical protein
LEGSVGRTSLHPAHWLFVCVSQAAGSLVTCGDAALSASQPRMRLWRFVRECSRGMHRLCARTGVPFAQVQTLTSHAVLRSVSVEPW